MRRRIAIWAVVGFLVACCWTLYAFAAPTTPTQTAVWSLANLTFPITLAAGSFKFSFYWALLANAVTYAFLGLVIETLGLQFRHTKLN